MKHHLTYLFFLILLLPVLPLQAQITDKSEAIIYLEFSEMEHRQLTRAQEKVESAAELVGAIEALDAKVEEYRELAQETWWRPKRRRYNREAERHEQLANDKRLEMLDIYREGYGDLYKIYHNKLMSYPEELRNELASKTIERAENTIGTANSREEELKKSAVYYELMEAVPEIINSRETAIGTLKEAFCLTINCEPNDQNEWEQADNGFGEQQTERENIVFQVQIIAVSRPLTDKALQKIYDGQADVIELKENGLYKYSVGAFFTYDEAASFRDNIIGDDSFVVAFLDGEKIDILEAIQLSKIE